MKYLIISLIITLSTISCSKKSYYEYDIINESSDIITVKIITTGSPYQEILQTKIEPGKSARVFEHLPYGVYANQSKLKPLNETCKYFKSFEISNSLGKTTPKNFFCNNCATFKVTEGRISDYGQYTLIIKDEDFQ